MPTFMTIHRSPGLSPEEIAANGPLVAESARRLNRRAVEQREGLR